MDGATEHVRALAVRVVGAALELEALFRLPPAETAADLGRLVVETRDLVARELPDLELPLRRPPGTGAQPWRAQLWRTEP